MSDSRSEDQRRNAEISELISWLQRLWASGATADPLTLANVHRRLSRLHADASDAAADRMLESDGSAAADSRESSST